MISALILILILCVIMGIATGNSTDTGTGLVCTTILFTSLISTMVCIIFWNQRRNKIISDYKNGKFEITLDKTKIINQDTVYYYNIK